MEPVPVPTLRIPLATYRLQFNHQFRFVDAKMIVRYLSELGITDIYSSPYLRASEGSLHGYDIVDHNQLNPEVGSIEEYEDLVRELRVYEMGQILDIVPNHMCITNNANSWWMDVLENGPSSKYAGFFDIDWEPVKKELKAKVLLPLLGDQYGTVLERGELTLSFREGTFFLNYFDNRFPLRPKTYSHLLQHKIEDLKEHMDAENPSLMELMSIITALRNLPSHLEVDPAMIDERSREKEIVKRRLWALYTEDPVIREFVDQNIRVFNGVKDDPGSFDLLDDLSDEQAFRLSYWPVATEEINYRRFFDINNLAAIRMENPEVYAETHKLLFKLVKERKVTGLRVDHPDGLYDPSEYFHRLQRDCFEHVVLGYAEEVVEDQELPYGKAYMKSEIAKRYDEISTNDHERKPFYIVGEKILLHSERMPEEWPIFSTTGYVFLNSLNGIFVETRNGRVFEKIYSEFIRSRSDYQQMVYRNKKLVMEMAMASEINTLGHYLNRISEKNRHTRDFTLNSLVRAIVEVIALFPVYRTYINRRNVRARDRQHILLAVAKAKKRNPTINASILDFLRDILLLKLPDAMEERDRQECLDFVMRFQQITGPVMAKGLEDTTFYVYNRLTSLNEVGGSPDRFGTALETFHGQNIERTKFWPHALIASSTHDSKRSEDVRARINVLSEIPDEWKAHLVAWARLNKAKKMIVDGRAVPDRNEEYLLYQTLIGTWPISELNGNGREVFKQRIKDYMVKAMREAKVRTSWINPYTLYEEATGVFVDAILRKDPENPFLADFAVFQEKISNCGMYNSLSQTLLKITCPGIPDFYQGTELWDFSLVDPDNRRPVDYGVRMRILEGIKGEEAEATSGEFTRKLTANRADGKIKTFLVYKALNYRKAKRIVFETGEYTPLETFGVHAVSACAFARRHAASQILTIVPRFFTRLINGTDELPLGVKVWGDTVTAAPVDRAGIRYKNIFTGADVVTGYYDGVIGLSMGEVFKDFPVALLEEVG